jgi:adhesin transport system outer membrane protein
LSELIYKSVTSHPSVQAQLSVIQSADASIDSAKWNFYPTPGFSVQRASFSDKDPQFANGKNQDDTIDTIRLTQPLWTGGRLTALLDKAVANGEYSHSSLKVTRKELSLRVLQFYSNILAAKLRVEAIQRSLDEHEKLRALIERRIKGGVSPEGELTQVVMRMQQLQSDKLNSETLLMTSVETLSQLVGQKIIADDIDVESSNYIPILSSSSDLLISAYRNDPTLGRLESAIKLQEAEYSLSKAVLQPDINLRMERQYGSFYNPDLYGGHIPPLTRVYVEVGSNFGAGLSSYSNIEASRLRFEAAVSDLESGKRTVAEQLQVAHAQYSTLASRIETLKDSLDAAKEIQRAWERQFLAGKRTWNDLMNAVREINQIDIQISDAEANRIQSSWQIAIISEGLESVLTKQGIKWSEEALK